MRTILLIGTTLALAGCAQAKPAPDAVHKAAVAEAVKAENPESFRGKMADFASDRITVEVTGDGPDVILIHGLSSSTDVWRSTIVAVPGYRYHLVQVKGYAGVPAEGNATGPVVHPVAHAVYEYIKAAKLTKPAIVGHSMGGSIGMTLAAHHPEVVGKLMVVDMFPFMGAMFAGPNATKDQLEPIATGIRERMIANTSEASKAQIEQTINGMVASEHRRPAAIRDSVNSDIKVVAQGFYDLVVTDLRPDLAKVTAPMTVLYVYPFGAPIPEAQYDGFMTASFANARGAKIVKIPDSRHFIMWDNPPAFQEQLRAFLK